MGGCCCAATAAYFANITTISQTSGLIRSSPIAKNVPFPMLTNRESGIVLGIALLGFWLLFGTLGFVFIEGWSLVDSLYMTIITISTVGYGEVQPLSPYGRGFASILIVAGLGTAVYTFTRLGQLVLEGELYGVLGRRRMKSETAKLKNHYIICGFGRVGKPVAEGLKQDGHPLCVVDNNLDMEPELQAAGHLYLIGDATDEATIASAGLEHAKAVLALLPTDADNLFLTITAKELNPRVTVIARASEQKVEPRLKRGGADKVVSPYKTACARVIQAAVRPTVVEFMELATHREQLSLSMEEMVVSGRSALKDFSLAESQIRNRYGVVIIAIKRTSGEMVFNPEPSEKIASNDILVVIGKRPDLQRLEKQCAGNG